MVYYNLLICIFQYSHLPFNLANVVNQEQIFHNTCYQFGDKISFDSTC